ncbi:hypothetical protein E2C01_008116 [Portunus trituberculatus]|uniref:Uncharacterized protein n=1 Tax=Portunus trituberculatus TaxID=210409 RepID=A0A5B7D0S4_PORTR|nr:hypothetical protein [Portunus trituberculatus]
MVMMCDDSSSSDGIVLMAIDVTIVTCDAVPGMMLIIVVMIQQRGSDEGRCSSKSPDIESVRAYNTGGRQ